MAYISPEIGRLLAKQVREGRQRMDDRRERSKERWEGKRLEWEDLGEPLECPDCGDHYDIGAVCIACDVELQPAGSAELRVAPPSALKTVLQILVSIAALLGGIGLYAWIATF